MIDYFMFIIIISFQGWVEWPLDYQSKYTEYLY